LPLVKTIPFDVQQLRWLSRSQQIRGVLQAYILETSLEAVLLSEDDQVEAMKNFCSEHNLRTPDDINGFRRLNLLTVADFEWSAQRSLRYQRFCERDFLPKAEARFLERKTSLDRVVYSLIRVAEPGLARELYLRIVAGEADFALLAAEFSQGPESSTRGVVGPVPMLQAHPVLAQRLRTSSPGLLLEPFQIENWWLVVRVESYTPAVLDDPTRMAMAQELLEEWLQDEVKSQMLQLAPHLLQVDKNSQIS